MRTTIQVLVLFLLAALAGAATNWLRPTGALPWVFDRRLLAPPAPVTPPGGQAPADIPLAEILAASGAQGQPGVPRLIDARHREAYEKGHIPGATNVPAALLPVAPQFLLMRAPPDQPVILYCTGGDCDESNRVWEQLRALQYQRVRIFHGGWAAWEKSGHPIERGPDPLPLGK